MMTKTCEHCHQPFEPRSAKARFCGNACYLLWREARADPSPAAVAGRKEGRCMPADEEVAQEPDQRPGVRAAAGFLARARFVGVDEGSADVDRIGANIEGSES